MLKKKAEMSVSMLIGIALALLIMIVPLKLCSILTSVDQETKKSVQETAQILTEKGIESKTLNIKLGDKGLFYVISPHYPAAYYYPKTAEKYETIKIERTSECQAEDKACTCYCSSYEVEEGWSDATLKCTGQTYCVSSKSYELNPQTLSRPGLEREVTHNGFFVSIGETDSKVKDIIPTASQKTFNLNYQVKDQRAYLCEDYPCI